ncbi:MAG: hypothetical protein WC004_03825 [Candidatus Absconditabacterales bacterium]
MTNGATKNVPQIPESNRDPQEVALDRAISEVFYEFGLIEPAKPQEGMLRIQSTKPVTFTEEITKILNDYKITINAALAREIALIELTITKGNRKAILPTSAGSYGQELMSILQPQSA